MTVLYADNATSTLASGITSGATSLTLATGDGAKFPSPTNGDYFKLTLFQYGAGGEQNWEVVYCTARAGDVCTVIREREETIARVFNSGDPVQNRATAKDLAGLNLGHLRAFSAAHG